VNRKSVFYWLIGIVIAASVIAAAFYFDHTAQNFIEQHQDRLVNKMMNKISHFGDWPEHFAVGLLLAGIAWWRGSKKWTRIFLAMLIALAIAGLAGRVIKISTGRARPSVKTEEIWEGPRLDSKFHAFPSGHVAASTAFFTVLLFANWRIGLACLPIPLLIGFSRMYVAAHYLSDVVFAAVLGILCAIFVNCLFLREIRNPQSRIRN
jgi:membrane-associated phospholipid phosphatase